MTGNLLFTERRFVWTALAALLLLPPATWAQSGSSAGIEVTGSGTARAKPTAVEIRARVSGQAQLPSDAIVKFRDNKRRALDALKQAKVEKLSTEAEGFSVQTTLNQQQLRQAMMGQQQNAPKAKTAITEPIRITLAGIGTLEEKTLVTRITKVLDLARDNGMKIGPLANSSQAMVYNQYPDTTLARFVLEDPAQTRNQAYEAALGEARAKAERLAGLAGVELGKVLSIRELEDTDKDQPGGTNPYYAMVMQALESTDTEDQTTAKQFGPIPVHVKLSVRFAIQ